MEFLIFGVLIGLVIFTFLIIYNKKLKEKLYNKKKGEVEKQVYKDLEQLYIKRQAIINEIEEKSEFNSSLLKIREEELNRLILSQEEEKIKTLDEKIKTLEIIQTQTINENLEKLKLLQEEERKKIGDELLKIQSELNEFRNQREAVNEAILREREIKEQEIFFKIVIPQNDIDDIEVLKTIESRLKNREALNKLIYDVFIKRPLGELIKRITNGETVCGIYKITCLETGESYIGKSTNVATRWQNHIKTACGLDGAASSTFHTRLEQDGIWNYTFEILEKTEKDKLGEKEKFYIDLYQTDKQLNMRKG